MTSLVLSLCTKYRIKASFIRGKWSKPFLFFTNNSSKKTTVLIYNSMRKHSKLLIFLLKEGMGLPDLPELETDIAMPTMLPGLTSCHNLLRRKHLNCQYKIHQQCFGFSSSKFGCNAVRMNVLPQMLNNVTNNPKFSRVYFMNGIYL